VSDARTVPHLIEGKPLRSLRIEVVGGPDKGAVFERGSEAVTIGTAADNDLVVTDETVSRYHAELRPIGDRVLVIDHGSTNGTAVGPAHLARGTVSRGAVLALGKTMLKILDGAEVEVELFDREDFFGLIGKSRAMRRLMARLAQVAKTDVSVLLNGETGTGKEVVARAIHLASGRADRPLEIVDCGALMPSLVESELFGHEKGAFTGANQQYAGAFERADGGTIFLDEIGELTAELQVRLLGVLERRAFRRVGGSKPVDVDVRVITATHRDLRRHVNTGEFRQDLYYRIAVARLEIPPLRDRIEDVELLAQRFLAEMEVEAPLHQVLAHEALMAMARHQWPGNVRELRNFVESAVAFGGELPDLEVPEGPAAPGEIGWARYFGRPYREARDIAIRDFQRAYLKALLEKHGDNVTRAAQEAGMNRPHLIQILKRLGLR
jgi:DNA-binding NtrC family response regulator